MIIAESFSIDAPLARVWAFFLDIPRSSACMPGVTGVEQTGEQAYQGRVEVKVGPLKAGFSMTVDLTEIVPPERIALTARGNDRGTSSMVQATVKARLAPEGETRTAVTYEMDVAIRGPLGRFGQTVIRDTARKMAGQFAACVAQRLAAPDKHEARHA